MKNIILIIGFVSGIFINAQTSGKNLLDKATKKMKSYTSMYSTFDYHLDNNKENIHDKQSGYIYLKGERYNLSLLGIKQIFDGKKIYTISEEDEEVTISKGENEDALLTPTKVLDSYKKGFKITLGEKKGTIQYIVLTPEKKSNTQKVVIGIDSKTNDLYSVMEENNEGTQTTLTLTNLIPNFPVPTLLLQYDKNKYKDYLITEID
ncbi:MAG: LolA family protein [Flavobacteriales bacterium]